MPSQTFYNLSSAKQEMLLAAARAEFARVPFREASINQIVRAAHISRGSFYMYFRGKEELLFYLMKDICSAALRIVEKQLEESGGDLFSVPAALYDFVMAQCKKEDADFFRHISEVIHWEFDGGSRTFLDEVIQPRNTEQLQRKINLSALSLQSVQDLTDLTVILISVTLRAVIGGLLDQGKRKEIRQRLENQICILKRGAKTAHTQEETQEGVWGNG